jgi:hypothetical protein
VFSTATLGDAKACRTECEISDDSGNCVAVVYESNEGWHLDMLAKIAPVEVEEFNTTVATVNERGQQSPSRIEPRRAESLADGER